MKNIYHRSVYMPPAIINIKTRIYKNLFFTEHALRALVDDELTVFDELEMSGKNIVEASVEDGILIEALLEIPFDYSRNMYVAIRFSITEIDKKNFGNIKIKTVYLAEHDRMELLNKSHVGSKYYRPINFSEIMF